MAMKGYSTFPKAPALLEPHDQIARCHILHLPDKLMIAIYIPINPITVAWPPLIILLFLIQKPGSAEIQSVYSVTPADWAIELRIFRQKRLPYKAKEPNLPNYLLITEERTDGVMHFSRALVQSEMPTA